jgi:hypothetical protein
MEAILSAIEKTPVSTILILAGLFFLLLGLVTKIGGFIEVSAEQKRWTFPIGLIVLAIGLALQFSKRSSAPGSQPTGGPQASKPGEPDDKGPAPAPKRPQMEAGPPTGRISIMNAHSRLCLGPVDGGQDNNVEIAQYACDGAQGRFWRFTEISGDAVKILNESSQRCLTVAGGNTFHNTVSVQYLCDSDASRRWRYSVVDGSRVRLINVNSGLCLTIAGGGTDSTLRAVQYHCDGDPSRDWIIRPVE